MWFLYVLTFVNALAHNKTVALRYRIDVGFPIGIFDALLGLGLLAAVVGHRNFVRTDRTHPLLGWTVVLFAVAILAGAFGAFTSNADLRWILTALRNLATLPVCVVSGYYLLSGPRAARHYPYLQVFAGVGAALVVLLFFRSAAADPGSSRDINTLRAVAYVTNYAGIGATLLLFMIIAKMSPFPVWLAIVMSGFCFIGQFATLSRSDWLATIAGVLAIYFLLPSYRPKGKVVAALVGPPLIAVFLWAGLVFASAVTGRDFEKQMYDRVLSMLPVDNPGTETRRKAWDTRLSATLKELEWFARSPLIGQGFGVHETKQAMLGRREMEGLRHNTWSSTLAETGLVGFSAMACVVFGTIVVGRRMARDAIDPQQAIMGALGVITGSHYLFHGLATMSFNQMRWAIPLGIICGVVLRARALQLTQLRIAYETAYYYPPEPDVEPEPGGGGWGAVA